jgi:TonB family protein
MSAKIFYLVTISLFLASFAGAQKKETITSAATVSAAAGAKSCADLRLGRALSLPAPKYPSEARSARLGGTIEITAEIDENGSVLRVETISGNKLFQGASVIAAMKSKFAATLCSGVKTRASASIVYTFLPTALQESYSTPARIEDFADVKNDSEFYPVILDLTENYHLAFGYADGNFHAESALTRGDLAQFLRLTLDMLATRAKFAGKNPRDARIFFNFNRQKIKSVDAVTDLKEKEPYFESVKILLQNYDVALVDANLEFGGQKIVTQNELIDVWTQIFGPGAVPVNFKKTENFERTVSRGDFALFLQESLGVLTYKLLP